MGSDSQQSRWRSAGRLVGRRCDQCTMIARLVRVSLSILLLINIGEYWRILAIFVIFADLLGTLLKKFTFYYLNYISLLVSKVLKKDILAPSYFTRLQDYLKI